MKENQRKSWSMIPLLVIVLCNMLNYYLFKDVCSELSDISPMLDHTNTIFKFVLSPVVNILVAGILLYASKRSSVYQIVQQIYIIIAIFISSFLFFIAPSYISSFAGSTPVEATSFLADVKMHWVHATFYLFSTLWPPLTLLLFYGYLNNVVTFSRACRLYPTLSIISLLLSQFIMPSLTSWILISPLPEKMYSVGLVATACLLTTIYCFYCLNLMTVEERGAQAKSFGGAFILSLILLTVTVGITNHISVITWDFSIQIKNYPSTYWDFLESFSALKQLSILLAVVLLGFLSIYLKQNKISGWKNLCYLFTGLITLLVSTLIIMNLMSGSIGSYLVNGDASFFNKLLTSVGGSYQIFIGTVFYPTLLCLKHLAFVPIPFQDRFRTKVVIDLVFYKAGYFVVVFLQGSLAPLSGFKTQLMFILAFCFLVVLLVRILCINYLSKKLEPAV